MQPSLPVGGYPIKGPSGTVCGQAAEGTDSRGLSAGVAKDGVRYGRNSANLVEDGRFIYTAFADTAYL